MKKPPVFGDIVNNYRIDLENELYENKSDLEDLLAREGTFEKMESGEIGFNTLQRYVGMTKSMTGVLTDIALDAAEKIGGVEFANILRNDLHENANWEHGAGLVLQRVNKKTVSDPQMFSGAYAR